jgi:GNAT superfamily N-acetyltransferase
MAREIEKGDTYPMTSALTLDEFGAYWFASFAAVMLLGDWGGEVEGAYERLGGREHVEGDWEKECLGSFYVKPNYPGRSSHVCNGGFLVTDGARNRGVGRLMGEGYLDWAPKLVSLVMISCYDSGTNCDRGMRIRCSIWCMRRMWRVVGFGMLWGLRGLGE